MKEKDKLIVQEIHYWKKNKLLPEHYCDYLITLYTEGSEYSFNPQRKRQLLRTWVIICISVIALISALAFYFSDILSEMQISLQLILSVFFFLMFIIGIIGRYFLLQCVGLLVTTLLIAWELVPYFSANFSWFRLEGIWLSIAILFFALAWLLKKRSKPLCVTFYVNACVTFFLPSLLGLVIEEAGLTVIQILLCCKLIIWFGSVFWWHPLRLIREL